MTGTSPEICFITFCATVFLIQVVYLTIIMFICLFFALSDGINKAACLAMKLKYLSNGEGRRDKRNIFKLFN